MSGAGPSLREQAEEAELHYLGLRDLVARARDGKIKRPPEWIERMQHRSAVAEATTQTLYTEAQKALSSEVRSGRGGR